MATTESDVSMLMESDDESEDFFDEVSDEDENRVVAAPAAKAKPKAAAAKKPKNRTALSSSSANVVLETAASQQTTKKKKEDNKTIEERYQKKTQLEHILLRPDTYVGSVERMSQNMFVLDTSAADSVEGSAAAKIVERNITFTPALYKIFDEIVVNAADNKQRDPNMDKLDICVNPEENLISVKNNGKGIPIVMHKEHQVYIPTMIFGHLLTGSNFDDDEKKTTGGRNGYGAKLTNIFSTKFVLECVDVTNGLFFSQTFTNNMSVAHDPIVKPCTAAQKKKGDYVQVSFCPDLQRFGMTHLDDDTVGLLCKRAYDICGSMANASGKRLQVTLNGTKLPIRTFSDYLNLYQGYGQPVAYEKNERWEVGVASSPDSTMRQISFVNSISTTKGGGHVTYIADQVTAHLVKVLKKKNKGGAEIKPALIRNHLSIFVNCLIENPSFDSQTKEFLTTRPKQFGSKFELSDKFLKQVEKSEIVTTILSYANFKQREQLKRKGGTKKAKLTGIAKLDDANFAGTAKSKDCTLIITEGDSAKSLAMSGISVVGRDYYGVFPLRGKPLNVRDATLQAVTKNEEIKHLVDILGLKFQTTYDETNIKTLRYGHLMIMADQDTDGSHIKGLVINFIHHFWPTLLNVPGFLQQFITPIVKISRGKKSRTFFTLPEYHQWIESTGNNGKGYTIKYYKGLGTSTSAEAKDYFSHLNQHEIHFAPLSTDRLDAPDEDDEMDAVLPDQVTSGSDLIDMVFRKTRVEDRKNWLNAMPKDTYLDYSIQTDGLRYSDFINKEYILFSKYDNERSIPHLIDGFKPSQRKVLYACFKRKLKSEVKVAQLCGYIAEHSSYHHGEASLQGTIINMAQNFCGSNNINLLTPSGQFGTRRMGGKDHASARYIFTKLEPITRAIFHPDDDELLTYLNDDGMSIEPEFYMPVIPMVLVNGADGIGTGWSSTVCNYDPRDVIANLRRMLQNEEMVPMHPYYYGFTGTITPETGRRAGSYIVEGKAARINDTTMEITELPIRKWTQDFKLGLEVMLSGTDKKVPEIKDFKENHTDTTVAFTLVADKEKLDEYEKAKNGFLGTFKLTTTLSTTNMNLFDTEGRITKYETVHEIMTSFYSLRLEYYDKRKASLVKKLEQEQMMLANKARFVEAVCSGELVVTKRKRSELLQELQASGYDPISKQVKKGQADEPEDGSSSADEVDDEPTIAELAKGYEYLLGMKIWSLTYEKAQELRAQLEEKNQELAVLQAKAPSDIWLADLDAIEAALDTRHEEMCEAALDDKRAQRKSKKLQAAKNKKGKAKKKNDWSESESEGDDDNMMDSDDDDSVAAAPQKAKPVVKRAPKAKPAPKAPVVAKPAPVVAAAKKAVPAPAAKPAAPPVAAASSFEDSAKDSESEDDFNVGESLLDRMQKKLIVSPPAKKRSSPKIADFDSVGSDDLEELDATQFQPASLTPAVKKATKRITQPVKRVSKKPTPKKPKAKPAAKKKAPPAKNKATKKVVESDSESDDFEFQSDEEMAEVAAPPARATGRVRRPAAKKTYAVDSDEEDDTVSDDSEF